MTRKDIDCLVLTLFMSGLSGCAQRLEGLGENPGPALANDAGPQAPDGNGFPIFADGGADGGPGLSPSASRADAGPFQFQVLEGTANNEVVEAIHGSSSENAFLVTSTGRLLRRAGLNFVEILHTADRLTGVWVSSEGRVFAGGAHRLIHCVGLPCQQASDFAFTDLGTNGWIESLCGSGDGGIYAVGSPAQQSGPGRIWRFDSASQSWQVELADTATPGMVTRCAFSADGTFYGTAGSKILRRPKGQGFAIESVTLPAHSNLFLSQLVTVVPAGSEVFALGYGIFQRRSSGIWERVFDDPNLVSNDETLNSLGSGGADEALVAGNEFAGMIRWNGKTWNRIPAGSPGGLPIERVTVKSLWAPSPDLLFVGGSQYSNGRVLLGSRPSP